MKYKYNVAKRNTDNGQQTINMPITLSSIPKKSTKSTKKQDDATRVYKSNLNGPGPNAPQPPSPESDATDDNDETLSTVESPTTTTTTTTTPKKKSAKLTNLAQRLEVNPNLSELYPSKHKTQNVASH